MKGICLKCSKPTWHKEVTICKSCYCKKLSRIVTKRNKLRLTSVKPEQGRDRALRWFPKLGKCENGCGAKAHDRHHKDDNPLNNSRENVSFLCRKCHMQLDGRIQKMKRKGGLNQRRYIIKPGETNV